jgi:hypothetical protein
MKNKPKTDDTIILQQRTIYGAEIQRKRRLRQHMFETHKTKHKTKLVSHDLSEHVFPFIWLFYVEMFINTHLKMRIQSRSRDQYILENLAAASTLLQILKILILFLNCIICKDPIILMLYEQNLIVFHIVIFHINNYLLFWT